MPYESVQDCLRCKMPSPHTNGVCVFCKRRQAEEGLQDWSARPIEDKLMDLHLRLLKLEQGPNRLG